MIEVLDRIGVRAQERRSVILLLLGFLVVGNVVNVITRDSIVGNFSADRKVMSGVHSLTIRISQSMRARIAGLTG